MKMIVLRRFAYHLLTALVIMVMVTLNTSLISYAETTPVATTTALQSTSACSQAGCVTTLTATVTAGTVLVHPGLVLFCRANVLDCADSIPLGQAQLLANGTATLKLILPASSQSIEASFQG